MCARAHVWALSLQTTIADATLRLQACDIPSQFCAHYSGTAPGPVRPFGIEMRKFGAESANLKFTTAALTTARTQVRYLCLPII
jgi:hypothetical protein